MSNWISVKNRLPEDDGVYLCYCDAYGYGYRRTANFTLHAEHIFDLHYNGHEGPAWYDYDSEVGDFTMGNITHWMPLPEPPKEENV
jgi:hypothetical protein